MVKKRTPIRSSLRKRPRKLSTRRSRIVLSKEDYKALCSTVLARDEWKCRLCKRRSALHCHHIMYRSQGGDDASYNLITLCAGCHDAVHRVYVGLDVVDADRCADGDVAFTYLTEWRPGRLV